VLEHLRGKDPVETRIGFPGPAIRQQQTIDERACDHVGFHVGPATGEERRVGSPATSEVKNVTVPFPGMGLHESADIAEDQVIAVTTSWALPASEIDLLSQGMTQGALLDPLRGGHHEDGPIASERPALQT
jgi:hypothetical protein